MSPKSRRAWTLAALAVGFLTCACAVPIAGVGGYLVFRPQWQAAPADAKPVATAPAPKTKAAEEPAPKQTPAQDAGPEDTLGWFVAEPGIQAPRRGTFAKHPWWKQPMTTAKLAKIEAAIGSVARTSKAMTLDADGTYDFFRVQLLFRQLRCCRNVHRWAGLHHIGRAIAAGQDAADGH